MTLVLHRSNRTEALVEALGKLLGQALPADPFEPFPIVVGSRGMERWLRHEIATRLGIAAGLAFPFPRQAIAGAMRWLRAGAPDRSARFWEPPPRDDASQRWEPDAIALRLIARLRERAGEPAFREVARYLGARWRDAPSGAVAARELSFAREVGDSIDRLLHDRPEPALDWATDPDCAPERHRWLATLLGDLGAATDPGSPPVLHRSLRTSAARPTGRAMAVFGLSTMGPGDRDRLAAIARSIDVHLFILVPTDRWFRTQRTRGEARAARRAARSEAARRRTEQELAGDNPVLASLGAPSRDLQHWLEQVDYQGDALEAVDPLGDGPATLLHRLQSWILAAAPRDTGAPAWPLAPEDSSLSAHATYGALRQCEVLRDELLAMFAADPTLEPRDVVVMTPDIDTYAPLLGAVLSRTGLGREQEPAEETTGATGRLPRIPVAIADLGLRRTNPVAEVLLELLALAGDRLSAGRLLDLLALAPVRRAFELDDDDLDDIRALVQEARLCWGLDADDRAAAGQPSSDQNTARFALERLALGVMLPDEGGLAVVRAQSDGGNGERSLSPAVPVDVSSRDRTERVGRLTAFLRRLGVHRRAMREPAPLAAWRMRLGQALDDLTRLPDALGWQRAELETALDGLAAASAELGELAVERSALQHWLEGRFEIVQRGDRPITGAVQICALEPMRSVPFRVVALVGMDDGAFPRGGRGRTWDPMAEREPGERDRRESDRHLMLEAILSARDRLLLLWSGHDVAQGRTSPAAVPVEELLETIGSLTGRSRAELVQEHALQPWGPANFAPVAISFDEGMARAATERRELERGARPPAALGLVTGATEPLPAEPERPTTLRLDDLAGGLLAPHRLLLRDRLGLAADAFEEPADDREPLELDSLDSWSIRARIAEQLAARPLGEPDGALLPAIRARLAGEGVLPPGAAGRAVVAAELERARALLANAEAIVGSRQGPLELRLELSPTMTLTGSVPEQRAREAERLLEWQTPSRTPNQSLRLRGWVHLLAAIAAGHRLAGVRLVGCGPRSTTPSAPGDFLELDGDAEQARRLLGELVELWALARKRPLPLFHHTSDAVARVLLSLDDDAVASAARPKLLEAVTAAWHGSRYARGDMADPWIATFHFDYDPRRALDDESTTGLVGLARRVWLPLHRALARGAALGAAWAPEVEP